MGIWQQFISFIAGILMTLVPSLQPVPVSVTTSTTSAHVQTNIQTSNQLQNTSAVSKNNTDSTTSEASDSFTVSPTSGTQPLAVTIHFPKSLGNFIGFGDPDSNTDELILSANYCSNNLCTITHTYDTTGDHTIKLFQINNPYSTPGHPCENVSCYIVMVGEPGSTLAASETINVTGISNGHPSATVDQNIATSPITGTNIYNITVSGSASGTSEVVDVITPSTYIGATDFNSLLAMINGSNAIGSHLAPVVNDRWFGYGDLRSGSYKVYVFDYSQCGTYPSPCSSAALLATRTILVQ
jgi:hypothetical protein